MPNSLRFPRILLWLAAGLLTCLIGLYFRLYPLTHNVSSDAYEQGTMLVINKIRQSVTAKVVQQYPDLPPAAKEKLIKENFDKVLRENRDHIRKAFDEAGQQILKSSGENKHYLLEIDAYYFLSLTQELLEKGSFGTSFKDGKFLDPLMLAPLGYWQPQTWHPYIGAFIYKVVLFFNPKADLMFGVGFTAVVLFPFVLMAFLFACRSLGCGIFPAFIAATFFVLAPIYLQRSTFANFKDDAYNVFFPLMVLGLLFLAIDHFKSIKKLFALSLLISICLALYAQFWAGWGFLWGLSMAGIVAVAAFSFLKNRSDLKPALALTGFLSIIPFIAVGLIFGFSAVWQILLFALGELQKFIAPAIKDWPDLFIVVGELKKTPLSDVIRLTGGPIMFFGAVITLVCFAARGFKEYSAKTAKIIFLAIFFVVTLQLALNAQRFALLCFTPLSLLFAAGLEELWSRRQNISKWFNAPEAKDTWPSVPIMIMAGLLTASLIFPLATAQLGIRSFLSPIYNSAWDRALTKLRDHSPADSVINTWWSPGHFVKAIANRRVTFDGASIKGEQAYWMTRVYLSQTEDEALGILRMLNLSSNNAAEYLQKRGIRLSTAVPLLCHTTRLDRASAYLAYKNTLSVRDADELIKMTHGTPPPSYVLIYNEIVDGNVMLGYLGKWDFKKIEMLNKNPEALKKVPARNSPNYVNFIWSLVGGPYRQSLPLNATGHNGSSLLFDQGVMINTADMTATVHSNQYGIGIPASIFYAEGNDVVEKKLPGATLSYSLVFFKDFSTGAPRCVLLDRVLANSLIVRMYYFDGLGLKHFKPFSKESDLTGRTKIFIYEVKWD
ncbi:MAG: hypothetical protein HQL22_05405 [Candidatus Omnitrophica bacterium]|nr:hypothetical protein [Candidatus Omnitrophota bacterium]